MIFKWYLVCLEILYQLSVFYLQGDSLGAFPHPKTKIKIE